MQHVEMLFRFIGGLGMFLYGMNVMADGLQKSAGNRMKHLLEFLTRNRLMGILVGAGVTAIIQSSSATTVMVVGFVNAGLMNLTQAVGVIMGANIGTTVTAWLVSMSEWGAFLKPEFFAPLLIGIGAFMMLFSKKEKIVDVSEILVGFGVLFIGLNFMSGAITPYRDAPIFSEAFRVLGRNPILGMLAGLGGYGSDSELFRVGGYSADAGGQRPGQLELGGIYHPGAEYRYLCNRAAVQSGSP